METLSRVKKNQVLRNTIENDREEELVSPALSSYAERLNKINPMLTQTNTSNISEPYNALHSRREKSLNVDSNRLNYDSNNSSNIETDYINDFLEEVRNYNISKGYRSEYDTELDIFKKNDVKEITNIQQNEEVSMDHDELTQEIKKIIENDFNDDKLIKDKNENEDINLVLEETQKLRVQLNDYEKELIDMNQSVMSSHRVLNIVVFILVLVLVVMLGFAIYWVLYSKGYY
jgi:cytochrome c biogenesis protein ResB